MSDHDFEVLVLKLCDNHRFKYWLVKTRECREKWPQLFVKKTESLWAVSIL